MPRCCAVPGESTVTGDPVIRGLAYDSRQVTPGDLFFALPGSLVARRQTLVVQHVVAQLSGRLMGHASISAPLARNWGQLVGKRNLVSRFGQLCHRFRSNLTQKGRCSHPFHRFYIFLSLLKEPKSRSPHFM